MPRAARRRLIVAAAAAIVLLVAWCGYIGLFRNAVSDAQIIRLLTIAAQKDVLQAATEGRATRQQIRDESTLAHLLLPNETALMNLAQYKQAHRLNIFAAYRYHHLRGIVLGQLEDLQRIRNAIPATTRAA